MTEWWNKETRNEDGVFYGVRRIEHRFNWENPKDNFVKIKPPIESIEQSTPCDWDEDLKLWIVDVNIIKEIKCKEVMDLLEFKILLPFFYDVNSFQVDRESQISIMMQREKAKESIEDPISNSWDDYKYWDDINNNEIEFQTPESFLDFARSVYNHCQPILKKARDLKRIIRSMDQYNDILDYDITEGW